MYIKVLKYYLRYQTGISIYCLLQYQASFGIKGVGQATENVKKEVTQDLFRHLRIHTMTKKKGSKSWYW